MLCYAKRNLQQKKKQKFRLTSTFGKNIKLIKIEIETRDHFCHSCLIEYRQLKIFYSNVYDQRKFVISHFIINIAYAIIGNLIPIMLSSILLRVHLTDICCHLSPLF